MRFVFHARSSCCEFFCFFTFSLFFKVLSFFEAKGTGRGEVVALFEWEGEGAKGAHDGQRGDRTFGA